jgi:hypothetical protein
MSSLGLPDAREQTFTDGWIRFGGLARQSTDSYWDPRKGVWFTYHTTEYTIADEGIPAPDVDFKDPKEVYRVVEQSWSEIKAQHSGAFFDPHEKAWRIVTARKPTDQGDADLQTRMKQAKKELDVADAEHDAGVLNEEEWQLRRREIKHKYKLD